VIRAQDPQHVAQEFLGEGDRGVGTQVPSECLAPDAHAHLGLIAFAAEVAGDSERLAVSASEELGDLDPQGSAAPGAIAKRAVHLFGAAATPGHEAPFGLSVARQRGDG